MNYRLDLPVPKEGIKTMIKIIFWIVIVTVIISEADAAFNKTINATATETPPSQNGPEIPSTENNNMTYDARSSSPSENGHNCVQSNTSICNNENQPSSKNNVSKPSSENTEWRRPYKLDKCTPVCTSDNCSATDLYWNCTCNDGYELDINHTCNPIPERQCLNGKYVAPNTCTCYEGFQRSQDDDFICEPKCSEMISGSKFICSPVCNETCIFGKCKAPNMCVCDDGWEGDFCNKTTLLCGIPEPIHVNSIIEKSNLTESNTTKSTTENLRIKPDAPDCRLECLDQLGTISVNFTRKILNVTYNFIRIDSSCNIIAADLNSETNYKSAIGAVCGILLSVIIIYVAYILIKRIEKRKKLINNPTSTWHSDYEELIAINERD